MESKVIFQRDRAPYKKGDVVSFSGHDGVRTAKWLVSNGFAKEHCDCAETGKESGCADCNEKAKRTAMTSETSFVAEPEKPKAAIVTEIKLEDEPAKEELESEPEKPVKKTEKKSKSKK